MTRKTSKPSSTRREVLDVLAAVGPPLLDASRAIDTAEPTTAFAALRRAAEVLQPFLKPAPRRRARRTA